MTTEAVTRAQVTRFWATRAQACGTPWTCEGVVKGDRAGYIGRPLLGLSPDGPPVAACSSCCERIETGEPRSRDREHDRGDPG